jgi:hypothetical protein
VCACSAHIHILRMGGKSIRTRRLDRNDGAARRVAPPAASETSRTSSVRSGLGAPPLYAGRPDNRLVADSLEAEWNNKLRTLSEAQQNLEHQREQDRKVLSDQQRAAILSLATDFPRLWRDPNTPDRERKRMIRLLLEDFTFVRGEKITLHIRFKGGATKTLMVPAPLNAWQQRATNAAVVKEIDRLLDHHTYQQIVSILNERGLHSGEGKSFSVRIVARIQKRYGLMPRYDRLRKAGMLTVKEMAASLMRQHDKDEQDPEGGRWHGEKIDGRGLRQMICQEGSPSLRRRFAGPRQMPRHRGLRHGNAQSEQFAVNAGCTPQGIGLAHALN